MTSPRFLSILFALTLLAFGGNGCKSDRGERQVPDIPPVTGSINPVSTPTEGNVTVYKSPTCGCCTKWMDHMQENGFGVEGRDMADVTPVKVEKGVPMKLASCHTAVIDGYFIEGHVPAEAVKQLLSERPDIAGLTVPGMPIGSPGMEGSHVEKYDVLAVRADGSSYVFRSY